MQEPVRRDRVAQIQRERGPHDVTRRARGQLRADPRAEEPGRNEKAREPIVEMVGDRRLVHGRAFAKNRERVGPSIERGDAQQVARPSGDPR